MNQELRLKRLYYQSNHRGCKETDLVLGHFAGAGMATLAPDVLDVYERLLDENDADIWNWLTGKTQPPVSEYICLIETLKGYGLPTE